MVLPHALSPASSPSLLVPCSLAQLSLLARLYVSIPDAGKGSETKRDLHLFVLFPFGFSEGTADGVHGLHHLLHGDERQRQRLGSSFLSRTLIAGLLLRGPHAGENSGYFLLIKGATGVGVEVQ